MTHDLRLAIVSHVQHYRHEGRLYAYTGYAREIDAWAELFREVVIAAPCSDRPPAADCAPFARENVSVSPQRLAGGTSLGSRCGQLLSAPLVCLRLAHVLRRSDCVHVRLPGNLGFLGSMLAPLCTKRMIAKYAGQWCSFAGEPVSWRLQKAVLRSKWWRGPITVYGNWPHQPRHVVPFFTSILSRSQVEAARRGDAAKWPPATWRVLFVGRLTPSKNVGILLEAIGILANAGIHASCTIVGDGPERAVLEEQTRRLDLQDWVKFTGGLSYDEVLSRYEESHVLVLASQTEGWPKAIAEGMTFGLVCIGCDRGLVPQMLAEERGLVVEPGDASALAATLQRVMSNPARAREMGERAAAWAEQYTLEGLRDAIDKLLGEWWNVPVAQHLTETRA